MGWFRHNKEETRQAASIEIVAHKEAKKEVIEEARLANERLNKLLVQNGFTLKIFLAAGGQHPDSPTTTIVKDKEK